ncbi:MAG: twin-arginine translocase TatA/TatE family subunit [Candidatus Bathyarchaeota archaeon]|nr:twin-arginine translocase TatA/TatE family subunit [Candidatus Bathyarchaeota archaeon]
MGNTELLFILFIVLLLFGGRKLPELARSMGEAVGEFNKATSNPKTYVDEKTRKETEERQAIIEAAKKLGIEVEGRDLNDIAQDIVKATAKTELEK